MTSLVNSAAWQKLVAHADATRAQTLHRRFADQPERATTLSTELGPLRINYSRQRIDSETLALLGALAQDRQVHDSLAAVMRGDPVNDSEQRAACHNRLRASDADDDITAMRQAMAQIVDGVHSGEIRGATGKRFSHVVNIGIGGSDLGPRLAVDALDGLLPEKLRCHFCANIDPTALKRIFRDCPADQTLVLVSSKSFSTEETLVNAEATLDWLRRAVGDDFGQQVVAITANPEKARVLGISRSIAFPDWVGGRFSLWSAIGLPVALVYGMDAYEALLRGGESVDRHMREAAEPAPVTCGLIDVWNRNFQHCHALAILPYAERLRLLPDYLQQLYMESQGKSVDRHGQPLDVATGMTLFGSQGSNGQHSFYQLLHQGSDVIPCDFLLPRTNPDAIGDQQQRLLANGLSQSLVLMAGQSAQAVEQTLIASGMDAETAAKLARHKQMPGNRPSTLIGFDQVDAYTLGALIAFYEYRMLTASFAWGINPFDQWGVELGKNTSRSLFTTLTTGNGAPLDPVSAQLLGQRS